MFLFTLKKTIISLELAWIYEINTFEIEKFRDIVNHRDPKY